MKRIGLFMLAVAALAVTAFMFEDRGKKYDISWFGLGKEGRYHIGKPGEKHSIELDFNGMKPDESYEVEVYFNDQKLVTIKSSQIFTHTPASKGKYIFRFFNVKDGKRIRVKPKVINDLRKGSTKSRQGIQVSSTSSTGTVTATVDA